MKKIYLIQILIFVFLLNTEVVKAQYTQTVRGQVIDEATRGPLPGATVQVEGTDPVIATITDLDGQFKLSGVPVGRISIQISYMGYESSRISSVMHTSGKELFLNVELAESVAALDEVTVSGYQKDKTLNSMTMLSARSFSVEETSRYAGGLDDPGRLASVYAGVADGNLESNGIVVRGNAPSGVIYMVEGIEVENPNHFAGEDFLGGGFVSILSNQVMANSDFMTGAFPAEYGNALSAVFDMKLRNGNQQSREHSFQAGVLGLDFASEGPFVKGKKASYLFNYRYSTFGLMQSFLPESEGLPAYQDLSFKLNFPYKKGSISIWGAGGLDNYKYGSVNADNTGSGSFYINDNSGTGFVGIRQKHNINKNTNASIAFLANASYKSNVFKDKHTDMLFYDTELIENTTGKYVVSAKLNKKYGVRLSNRSGVNYSWLFYDLDSKVSENIPEAPRQLMKTDGTAGLLQAYSQWKYMVTERLTLHSGLNFQQFSLGDDYSLETRLGLNYTLNQKNRLSAAYGKHSQIQPIGVYFVERTADDGSIYTPNDELGFTKSHHFIVGYDRSLNKNMRIKVEPFYQYLTDVPVVDNSSFSIINLIDLNTFDEELQNDGNARNMGVDITFERFLNKGYYYMANVSVFDSQYKGGDGVWRNTRYNKNFVMNILGGKEWKAGKQNFIGVNGRLYVKNGDRTSSFDQQASAIAGEVVYDESRMFEKNNPLTYRCDMSLNYTINKEKYSSRFSLQVMNVFNSVVSYYDKYNSDKQQAETIAERMLLPSFSWKIDF